jgi:lysylphosphatidylglycerol synthetase-like protein (DUF2156 family)
MDMNMLARPLALSLVFTVLGVALFAMAIWIIVKVCPFSVRKEIEEDQNISLAIIIGAIIMGIALIVAAAIHGTPDSTPEPAGPPRGAPALAPAQGSTSMSRLQTQGDSPILGSQESGQSPV